MLWQFKKRWSSARDLDRKQLKNSFEAIRGIVINAMLVDADVCFAYVISKKKLKGNSRKIQSDVFFIELKVMKQKNGY